MIASVLPNLESSSFVYISDDEMPTKIFIGNIGEGTSHNQLMELFQQFGEVTECDILGNFGFAVSF